MNSISVNEMARMQFKRIEGLNLSEFGLDFRLFNVATALDGVRDVKTIAKEGSYDLSDLCSMIARLQEMGVVEALQGGKKYISKKLITQLTDQLSISVGPVASVLVDDVAAAMGYRRYNLPTHRLQELIERLGESIGDINRAAAFMQAMDSIVIAKR